MPLLLTVLVLAAQSTVPVVGPSQNPSQNPSLNPSLRLIYEDSLAPGADFPLKDERFWFSRRDEWSYVDSVADDGLGVPVPESGPALTFKSTGAYAPRVRSPHSLALIRGYELQGDFVVELEAMQTGVETPHRDLVLVFGFQSPEQFYYCHLGAVPDATSSNVFEVNESPRRRLGEVSTKPISWGRGVWHKLRLECTGAGRMRLFMDGATEPHFERELGRNPAGLVGFGSFDDAGAFRNLKLYAQWAKPSPTTAKLNSNDWRSSPFGDVVSRGAGEFAVGKSKGLVTVQDTDGDGIKGSSGDRWAFGRGGPLPFDMEFVTGDRLGVLPVLEADGSFKWPYRIQVGTPRQSRSSFLRASYDLSSEGHPSQGPWDWATSGWRAFEDKRPSVVAVMPHDHAESWRWDAELFSDPRVAMRLTHDFLATRIDSSPKSRSELIPISFADFSERSSPPKLVMLTHDGNRLGTTSDLTSPEALLKWLDEASKATPTKVERRAHLPPWMRGY